MSDDELRQLLQSEARVLVVRSPLTDLGPLGPVLDRLGEDAHQVELGMGSTANRDLYRRLKEHTGHPTLPLVFIDGEFVGGLEATARVTGLEREMPAMAAACGYGGLVPFVAGALALVAGLQGPWAMVLIGYAAVILSFVGAIHWGLALNAGDPSRRIGLSVLPALIAWLALLLAPAVGLGLLAVGLLAWRGLERLWLGDRDFPLWYRRLRDHLTVGAAVSVLVGAAALGWSAG